MESLLPPSPAGSPAVPIVPGVLPAPGKKTNMALIVGGVIGGLLFLVALGLVLYFLVFKKEAKKPKKDKDDEAKAAVAAAAAVKKALASRKSLSQAEAGAIAAQAEADAAVAAAQAGGAGATAAAQAAIKKARDKQQRVQEAAEAEAIAAAAAAVVAGIPSLPVAKCLLETDAYIAINKMFPQLASNWAIAINDTCDKVYSSTQEVSAADAVQKALAECHTENPTGSCSIYALNGAIYNSPDIRTPPVAYRVSQCGPLNVNMKKAYDKWKTTAKKSNAFVVDPDCDATSQMQSKPDVATAIKDVMDDCNSYYKTTDCGLYDANGTIYDYLEPPSELPAGYQASSCGVLNPGMQKAWNETIPNMSSNWAVAVDATCNNMYPVNKNKTFSAAVKSAVDACTKDSPTGCGVYAANNKLFDKK